MLRDGIEVEYEAFLVEDGADGLESMNWTGFLVIGAQVGDDTRLLKNHGGLKVEKQILKVAFCKVTKISTADRKPSWRSATPRPMHTWHPHHTTC